MSKSILFDHKTKEKHWQKIWAKERIYSPKIKESKNPFFNLWMFPYPSAEGLHAGHAFASTGSDVYGRYMKMKGKDVFQPIGYDAFGIHSENYALTIADHPKDMITRTTKYYEKQLRSLGHAYDWTHTVNTSEPDYYKWTQWLFVEMFKAGLAYRKSASVNWCPSCKTVLADEQVISGECERCGSKVERKELKQWFFRITDYSDRLLGGLGKIDWPESIKVAQKNWIGKREGAKIKFTLNVPGQPKGKHFVEVFTTRPDTLFGATFIAVSPQLAKKWLKVGWKAPEEVKEYIQEAQSSLRAGPEAKLKAKNETGKSGIFAGVNAVNPATKKEIPVWIADYVLGEVGTGAIMGVPAHDQRDFEFAKKYKLKIIEVISPTGKSQGVLKVSCEDYGVLLNSGKYSGMRSQDAIKRITEHLTKKKQAEMTVQYHLRDWLISRQRYWGPPIPMIYCQKCAKEGKSWFTLQDTVFKGVLHKNQSDWNHAGWYPEENLPVELPYLKNYQPKGTGGGPLAGNPEFYEVKCPECKHKAKRETDVSDTFLDSSWYYLAYPMQGTKEWEKGPWAGSDSKSSGQDIIDNKIVESWLPVDLYFGGAEHAVLHLMYARFVTQVLYDLKLLHFEEPFPKFFAHGLMIKDGAKMSKSRGNVVNPDEYIEKYGADTLRLYLMFMGPMDGYPDFRDTGIEGMRRFVERIWELFVNYTDVVLISKKDSLDVLIKMHQTIKKVTEDVEQFRYNTAISAIMEFVNLLRDKTSRKIRRAKGKIRCAEWDEALKVLAQLLAPFTPHLAEEVWVNTLDQKFSIYQTTWPKYNPELIKDSTVVIAIQVNGKLRATIKLASQDAKVKSKVLGQAQKQVKVKKYLVGKKLKDTIFVPGKIINFVI